MDIGGLLPVFTLVLGWALNEAGSLVRLRREDRRAAGPVLADLLEIRHQLTALEAFRREVATHLPIPAQGLLQLQNFILGFVPATSGMAERYEEAVSTLAHVDPITAFRLRGKTTIGPLLSQLRGLAAAKQAESEFWLKVVEPEMLGAVKPALEALILEVARTHGWTTWWRTRKRLKEPELSEDEKAWVSQFMAKLKVATSTETDRAASSANPTESAGNR